MLGRLSRISIAGLIIWLLWGARVLWPSPEGLPDDTVVVTSTDELSQLPGNQNIAIEGRVFPAAASSPEALWQERFAYRRAISQKSETGGREEVVRHELRPAVRFEWSGETFVIPAESYQMESAPEAPGDSVLLTTEHNVGFKLGDTALALGQKSGNGSIVINELTVGPLEVYLKTLKHDNHLRSWLSYGFRGVITLFAVMMLLNAFRGGESERGEPEVPAL